MSTLIMIMSYLHIFGFIWWWVGVKQCSRGDVVKGKKSKLWGSTEMAITITVKYVLEAYIGFFAVVPVNRYLDLLLVIFAICLSLHEWSAK